MTGGQLAWYGRANKGEFIGRLAEYNPVAGTSSSFSCPQACLCLPGFHSGSMTPNVISGFVDDTFSFLGRETDADCNQANQFTYDIYNSQFFSSNTDVVTISGSTATLVGGGGADITASWDTFMIAQQCTLASDGECIDARCLTDAVTNPIVDALVDALSLQYTVAATDFEVANFTRNISTENSWNATLELTGDNPICTGSTFSMKVRLRKAGNVTLFPASDTRNIVDTPSDSQYRVNGGGLQDRETAQPFFSISLKRISPNNPNRHIRTVAAGTDFSGSIRATGLVTLNCP